MIELLRELSKSLGVFGRGQLMDIKKIQQTLSQLAEVNEQLISLADDIWLDIDPRDNESIAAGAQFLQNYNQSTEQLSQAAAAIEQQLSQYFQQNSESLQPIIEQGSDDSQKNQRMIKELDRSKAYSLRDNFTFKRPYGFVLNGIAYTQITTWKAIYLKVLDILHSAEPNKFAALVTEQRFISSRGNPLFAHQKEKLRVAHALPAGFYTEVNMSANTIKDALIQVLEYFSIDESNMKIYLREDRDA